MSVPTDPWHFARPDLAQAYLQCFDLGLTSARGLFARRRMGKVSVANHHRQAQGFAGMEHRRSPKRGEVPRPPLGSGLGSTPADGPGRVRRLDRRRYPIWAYRP